jgi:hypothetical protein
MQSHTLPHIYLTWKMEVVYQLIKVRDKLRVIALSVPLSIATLHIT